MNAASLESGVNRLDCVEEQRLGARRRYDSPIAPTFLGLEHLARVNSVPYRDLASLQGALLSIFSKLKHRILRYDINLKDLGRLLGSSVLSSTT